MHASYRCWLPLPPDGSFRPRDTPPAWRLLQGKRTVQAVTFPPLFTEPGWNLHTPEEMGIDAFQAERSPDRRYRTAPLEVGPKGGFTMMDGLPPCWR